MPKAKKKAASKRVSPTGPRTGPPKVDYQRNELVNLLPFYFMIRDAIDGEPAIKGMTGTATTAISGTGNGGFPMSVVNIILAKAQLYLPMPNERDQSPANIARYKAYVTRAVYYNATRRTLEGMTGQIFLREPVVTLPTELDLLTKDADGGGLSLDQTSNKLVRHCIAFGRSGILIDYPVTNGVATKAEIAAGDIRPTLTTYNPWDIINWRIETTGAKRILTFLVLREAREEEGFDGFQLDAFQQYRVLSLDAEGNHLVEVYRKDKQGNFGDPLETYQPKDAKGKQLTIIPFTFVGAEDNNEIPDLPPLYDLASVNIAHYRNSADYEESCFIVGQPTPVLTGLSEDWVKNILKDVVELGARTSIPLPVGGQAQLLQAAPNSMPMEGMVHKEAQMVAIGAKLVQNQKSVSRTATETIIETTSESSTLANIAKNVSAAVVWALGVAANFVGAATDTIKYDLNKDFDLTSMTADDQNAVIKEWQSGAITFPEMRTVLRRAGVATVPDDEARTTIDASIEAGQIPDPALVTGPVTPPPAVPGEQAPSGAGGPQPKAIRRKGPPGTTA